MLEEQLERIESNSRSQKRIMNETIERELMKQRESWNDLVSTAVLVTFLAPDLNTAFFVERDNLRKRSNLSFDERVFMRAPNNIELRMPVAIRLGDGEIELYDPYGSMTVKVNKKPEYELVEDRIYIMRMVKHYAMYPLRPVLEENCNGVELHLSPTALSLYAEPKEGSDFSYLAEQPYFIPSEDEAIDFINCMQNYYRLKGYSVERRDPITIAVEGRDRFILGYSRVNRCVKVGI